MTVRIHDAIVVGARCAGAPTAMLLAQRGYDVLLVDRVHFPSDTVSTHLVHPHGVDALARWGLLDELVATGCPPVDSYSFDFGPIRLSGRPASDDREGVAYCPRRTVLDAILVDAARRAGAEVREGFALEEVLTDADGTVVGIRGRTPGGAAVDERSRVVIGADGAHSRVAAQVRAPSYQELPALSVGYYSYWSGVVTDGAEWIIRPGNGFGAFPTNDGLTMLLVVWPHAERHDVKADLDAQYHRGLQTAFGDRILDATREERIVGGGVPNRFRVPFGPGWALVGDAGYLRDPVTAQGITDAFLDAEGCAAALDASLRGSCSHAEAMGTHQRTRDARVRDMYHFTTDLATMEPPPPELQQLLAAIDGNARAMDQFASVFAGTLSPPSSSHPVTSRSCSAPVVDLKSRGVVGPADSTSLVAILRLYF